MYREDQKAYFFVFFVCVWSREFIPAPEDPQETAAPRTFKPILESVITLW